MSSTPEIYLRVRPRPVNHFELLLRKINLTLSTNMQKFLLKKNNNNSNREKANI